MAVSFWKTGGGERQRSGGCVECCGNLKSRNAFFGSYKVTGWHGGLGGGYQKTIFLDTLDQKCSMLTRQMCAFRRGMNSFRGYIGFLPNPYLADK
jgi:hypothetical protein